MALQLLPSPLQRDPISNISSIDLSPLKPTQKPFYLSTHPSLSSSSCSLSDLSFSSSLSPLPLQFPTKSLKPNSPFLRFPINAVAVNPQELPRSSPKRLLKELEERKKTVIPKKKIPPKRYILKPPLDDQRLTARFLNSPQLSLKAFPLLSSCLPSNRLNNADKQWIDEYLLEAKQALGYPLEPSEELGDDNPAKQFDTLLYLAFQHPSGDRTNARHVRSGHSRLWFLGQYVLELAFAEFFLQRYPRESPASIRERVFGFIGKRNLTRWIKAASLQNLIFPYDDIDRMLRKEREPPVKSVFWAIFGAIYLCFGMPEVYRVLFEAFGMDPKDESCQPRQRRQLEDVDYVSVEFEERQLSWQDVASYKLCYLHPSKYKFEHPRFCFERLEYVGQKIQDLVMAERLLMKHLDAPGRWIQERHRRLLMNKFCGRYLRDLKLHPFIVYGESVLDAYEHNRRLRNPATTAVNQALHGLSYVVYGKPDVRRLMFEIFDFEQVQPKPV
ncbi:ribonuclease III domain-containing protein RNC1, chloroplastic isoform X2 [Amborella trichopoda]|uniref:ribonuclease III domain-containing protein RNC1, chloroplastic isoform X2 n=1 Tax=Amborella trichopoda TaxID=13333 RepID=UPI0005D3364E|nr:ribonuclease III domain-containing protein RNC1, chloroplastic isoform X2 [Amborella trichopoda]|eukprot:XP_011620399.1 ribonuclease III domain-containing protein RNC1, chloroplastic isoform X2 [Amborella trichopoda]